MDPNHRSVDGRTRECLDGVVPSSSYVSPSRLKELNAFQVQSIVPGSGNYPGGEVDHIVRRTAVKHAPELLL